MSWSATPGAAAEFPARTLVDPTLDVSAPCVDAEQIAAELKRHQKRVALLPPGLVEPATQGAAIAGKGPWAFGASCRDRIAPMTTL